MLLTEIEECVRFLASFLFGKVPRRRAEEFVELLANALVERMYHDGQISNAVSVAVNVTETSDLLMIKVVQDAHLSLEEVRRLWPKGMVLELREGFVNAVNSETGQTKLVYTALHQKRQLYTKPCESVSDRRARRRLAFVGLMPGSVPRWESKGCGSRGCQQALYDPNRRGLSIRVEWASCDGTDETMVRPFFQVLRGDVFHTAQEFAATRFGSTKPKSHQMDGNFHAFTTPSVCAYLQLLVFLNALACLTVWSEQTELINKAECDAEPTEQKLEKISQNDVDAAGDANLNAVEKLPSEESQETEEYFDALDFNVTIEAQL